MPSIDLYNYQIDAIKRMKSGCILCGGVGSGKTRTALAYYYISYGGKLNQSKYVKMKNPVDLYVITTAKKRDSLDWQDEMVPFLFNQYKIKITVDSWNNIQKYKETQGSFFIFDEQRVIGFGPWTKAFLKIAKSNKWILLSATPGDNWLDYAPVFIANGFYKNKSDFIDQHVTYKPFRRFYVVDESKYRNVYKLQKIRDFITVEMNFERQTVSHHIDIPVSYDIIKYKSIVKNRWNPWKDQPIRNASEFCLCLRKVVNSDETRKMAVETIVKNRKKVIIFYNYDYELEILRSLNYPKGTKVSEWNGHNHMPLPETDKWVYLVQYTAGAEGWNCIATDTIIFYSQNYSYKIMVQSAGRIDRANTPYTDLYYYHLKSKASIDIAIARVLKTKKKFNEKSFYGGNTK